MKGVSGPLLFAGATNEDATGSERALVSWVRSSLHNLAIRSSRFKPSPLMGEGFGWG
jgi:hypothetical protein